jgi:hypothetical protein
MLAFDWDDALGLGMSRRKNGGASFGMAKKSATISREEAAFIFRRIDTDGGQPLPLLPLLLVLVLVLLLLLLLVNISFWCSLDVTPEPC